MTQPFDEETVDAVFAKAEPAPVSDRNKRLCPECGTQIHRNARVDRAPEHWQSRTNPFSWHVDHIKPKSKGGTADLSNLRPLCSKCNLSKGNREA